MKNIIFIISLILLTHQCFAENKDSLQIINLKLQVEQLENKVKEIRRDELNYKIEKDLLKETYSNNYGSISLVITIVLGIIGLFGYLGLKDINSIKKEYTSELVRLNELKAELEGKIKQVSDTQIKYEKEISEIIKQNEEQNKKIKILELDGQIRIQRSEKKYPAALESCLTALHIDPSNTSILLQKGLIYSITRSYAEAVQTYTKILEFEPDNNSAILNLSEAYILNEQNEKSDKLIEENNAQFNGENGKEAIKLFSVLKSFNNNGISELIKEIKNQIDISNLNEKKNRMENWGLTESLDFIDHKENSLAKDITKSYYDYIQSRIDGNELLKKLDNPQAQK